MGIRNSTPVEWAASLWLAILFSSSCICGPFCWVKHVVSKSNHPRSVAIISTGGFILWRVESLSSVMWYGNHEFLALMGAVSEYKSKHPFFVRRWLKALRREERFIVAVLYPWWSLSQYVTGMRGVFCRVLFSGLFYGVFNLRISLYRL